MPQEPEGEKLVVWLAWLNTRPEPVRQMISRFPPWRYFRMISTGQVGFVCAISEHHCKKSCVVADPDVNHEPIQLRFLAIVDPRPGRMPYGVHFEIFGCSPKDFEPAPADFVPPVDCCDAHRKAGS